MDTREIKSTLVSKLDAAEDRKGHHIYYWMIINGEEFRVGKLSHSLRGQAPDFIISDTAKRLKLTKKEFTQLVECSLGKETHSNLWNSRSEK